MLETKIVDSKQLGDFPKERGLDYINRIAIKEQIKKVSALRAREMVYRRSLRSFYKLHSH